jgi:hypothetical protein
MGNKNPLQEVEAEYDVATDEFVGKYRGIEVRIDYDTREAATEETHREQLEKAFEAAFDEAVRDY